MRIETDVKLDFKDVLIRPKRSTLNTRSAVDVDRAFRFLHTGSEWKGFPLIAANMDVTGTMAMARALGKHGALTALHKHYPEPKLAEFFASPDGAHAFYSLGTTAADVKKLAAVAKAAPIRFICLDVANGYAEKFLETVKRVRDDYPHAVIMAGNVVTGDMTEALILAGADIVKIGIGPGSVCTTRRVTGVGYPQLSAIIECADAAHGLKGQVCADGGCTVPGDVAKAYGAGADFVMLGGMLAGHDECDGANPLRGARRREGSGRHDLLRHVVGDRDEEAFRRRRPLPGRRGQDGRDALSRTGGRHDGRDHGRRALDDDLYRRGPPQGGPQAHHLRARHRADQRGVRPIVTFGSILSCEPACSRHPRRPASPQDAGSAHSSGSPALIRASRKPGGASIKEGKRA